MITLAYANIYIPINSTLVWPDMTEVVGSSPVIGKDFSHFHYLFVIFLTCRQTCKLGFTGFMIKNSLIKKPIALPINCKRFCYTPYSLTLRSKDLFGIATDL